MNGLSTFTWRQSTTNLLLVGLVTILIALVASFAITNFKPTIEVRVGSGVYNLWVADNNADLQKGLSGIKSLKPNNGLLMKFDHDGQHGIWMKDMEIPLDIIWLDSSKTVVYIVKNAQPELGESKTFSPKKSARYVIELVAGSVDKSAIKIGSIAVFEDGEE